MQSGVRGAETLLSSGADLTLVPFRARWRAHLRAAHLTRLRAAGVVGELLASQAQTYAADHNRAAAGRAHTGLPDHLLNVQHDPVAGAVALGWPDAVVEQTPLSTTVDDGCCSSANTHRTDRPTCSSTSTRTRSPTRGCGASCDTLPSMTLRSEPPPAGASS